MCIRDSSLAALAGHVGAEGDVRDLVDELVHPAGIVDSQCAVDDAHRRLRRERAEEEQRPSALADVDEAAGAGEAVAEAADVDVAVSVDLSEAQDGLVQAPAVLETEHVRRFDDRLGVGGGPEERPPAGMPPMPPGSTV